MKRAVTASLLLFICLSAHARSSLVGRVVRVVDGDTIVVLDARNDRIRVGLVGVDAPERVQAYGEASRRSLANLCAGQPVAVYEMQENRYGYLFGKIYCAGVDATVEQVKLGMAWVQDQKSPLYKLQKAAQSAKIGLWADSDPIPPWDYRERR
ncbi:MAG: thermonuclease family protein [Candidatus Accumulibacter sp.]|jgi:endonuclease YncB( thermonuclease family)|nr:thermonuclease family protein [Accumulibacter sp.]